jgi:hypothetical protein
MRQTTKIIIVFLILFIFLTGCEDLIQEAIKALKITKKAQWEGKATFCPEDKPYRVGGLTGVCVDSDKLADYIEIKMQNPEDEEEWVKKMEELAAGEKKDCPPDKPYYRKTSLFKGECMAENETASSESEENKDCQYDSECEPICEGHVQWKQGCNPRSGKCEKTFEHDCTTDSVKVAGYTFQKTCVEGVCAQDNEVVRERLENEKEKISAEVKAMTAQRQRVSKVMLDAQRRCLDGLSDVTNKLIVETALKVASPATGLKDVASDSTMGIVDELTGDPDSVTPDEFIAINCKLYKALQTDLDVLEKKIDRKQEEYKKMNDAIKNLG